MSYRFALDPVDESFFDTAPLLWSYPIDLTASPAEVWEGLTVAKPLSWCRMLTNVEYIGKPPFGVGVGRKVEVGKTLRMQEHFFRWNDAERRHSFYVTHSNVPIFTSFAEDYQVVATPTGSRLVWTFAMSPGRGFDSFLRLGAPINKALFTSFVRDTSRHFGAAVSEMR